MSSPNGSNLSTLSGFGNGAYSAEIRLSLLLPDGGKLSPAQIGPDWVVFHEDVTVPPGPAIIEMLTDGKPRRWDVILEPGPEPSRVVPIRDR